MLSVPTAMEYSIPLTLLLAVLRCTPATSHQSELTNYIVTAVQYLTSQTTANFLCVFFDFNSEQPFSDVSGEVLQSPELDDVLKIVVTSSFRRDPDILPVRPNLVLVNAESDDSEHGLDYFLSRCKILLAFHGNTFVLVLVKDLEGTYFEILKGMITMMRFNKVAYLVTKEERSRVFPGLSDLFGDTVRTQTRSITYSKATPLRSVDFTTIQWIRLTAQYLNTSATLVENPCKTFASSHDRCFLDFFHQNNIDIDIGKRTPRKGTRHSDLVLTTVPEAKAILVPRGRPLNTLEMFVAPFDVEVWIVLVLLIVFCEVLSSFAPALFKNYPILLVICGFERYNLHRANRYEKLVLLSMIIFFFFMTNAYETKIISMMTSKPSCKTTQTLAELADSGIKVKYDLRLDPTIQEEPQLKDLLINSTDGYAQMDGIHAYLVDRFSADHLMPLHYFDEKLRRTKYVQLEEVFTVDVIAHWLSFRSPLAEVLDRTYAVFVESGMMTFFTRDLVDKERHSAKSYNRDPVENELLEMSDLIIAWNALGWGTILAGGAFIVEMIVVLRKKRLLIERLG